MYKNNLFGPKTANFALLIYIWHCRMILQTLLAFWKGTTLVLTMTRFLESVHTMIQLTSLKVRNLVLRQYLIDTIYISNILSCLHSYILSNYMIYLFNNIRIQTWTKLNYCFGSFYLIMQSAYISIFALKYRRFHGQGPSSVCHQMW